MVFLYFWGPEDIPDSYVSGNIITRLDCMTVFGICVDSGINKITSDQVARWSFGNLFVPFRLPKMIVVEADGLFAGMLNQISRRP